MKSWTDPYSPWGKQFRFDDREFEVMMDELRIRTGEQKCFAPGKGVNVDLVLLRTEGIEPDYVDLPNGILGRTIFSDNGNVRVEISRGLSDEAEGSAAARRRLRTTVAHECGHIACHRALFLRDTETYSLFDDTSTRHTEMNRKHIMCRPEGVGDVHYAGEWWEYQANQCMAALLLPRRLFADCLHLRLSAGGFKSATQCFCNEQGERLVREIADEFDVNPTVVVYRMQKLGFVTQHQQASLRLVN